MPKPLTLALAHFALLAAPAAAHGARTMDDPVATKLARGPELLARVTDAAIEAPAEIIPGHASGRTWSTG